MSDTVFYYDRISRNVFVRDYSNVFIHPDPAATVRLTHRPSCETLSHKTLLVLSGKTFTDTIGLCVVFGAARITVKLWSTQ